MKFHKDFMNRAKTRTKHDQSKITEKSRKITEKLKDVYYYKTNCPSSIQNTDVINLH